MPFCRNCGTEYTEGDTFCQKCGANLTASTVGRASATVSVPGKDAGIAALLAGLVGLFLLGIGHLYVGKIGRGVIFLVTGIITKVAFFLALVGGLAYGSSAWLPLALLNIVLWVFQIYDAYRFAKLYNEGLEKTGKPPW